MKKVTRFVMVSALSFGLVFAISSCDNNETEEPAEEEVVEEEEVIDEDNAINDAIIAHIAVTANAIDVDYAEIALERGSNKNVKEFAEAMKTDHNSVIEAATALAEKLGVTPEDNETSQALIAMRDSTIASWEGLSGSDFDKAYINNEVGYHEYAINAVENVLVPNAQNEELKELLESALPLFNTHLEHSKMAAEKVND